MEKSFNVWKLVLQQCFWDQEATMWTHQIQHRVELILRANLASVFLGNKSLIWTSVLQLPQSFYIKSVEGMQFCAVGAADKKESVGGTFVPSSAEYQNPILMSMLLHEDGRKFARVKEGVLVKTMHDILYERLAAVQDQQELSPPSSQEDNLSCSVLCTLLERKEVVAIKVATFLAHVLAQRYDTSSPLYHSPLATWYSVADNWYYKRLAALGLPIGVPYVDILGFGHVESSTTEGIFQALNLPKPSTIVDDHVLSVPALVRFWMKRCLSEKCTLVFDVGAFHWVTSILLHASSLPMPKSEHLFHLSEADMVVVHARRTAGGYANDWSLCLLSINLAILLPITPTHTIQVILSVALPSDTDTDALWKQRIRMGLKSTGRERGVCKHRSPFTNGGHILGGDFNQLLAHDLTIWNQSYLFYKEVNDIFRIMRLWGDKDQEERLDQLHTYGASFFGGGLGGNDRILHRVELPRCTDQGCTDAWIMWLSNSKGLISAFADVHPMWSKFFDGQDGLPPLHLSAPASLAEAKSTQPAKGKGKGKPAIKSIKNQPDSYSFPQLRDSTIGHGAVHSSPRVGQRFQVSDLPEVTADNHPGLPVSSSSELEDDIPLHQRPTAAKKTNGKRPRRPNELSSARLHHAPPPARGTRGAQRQIRELAAVEDVDRDDVLTYTQLHDATKGRIRVFEGLLRFLRLDDALNRAKSASYTSIYNTSDRFSSDSKRMFSECPDVLANELVDNLWKMDDSSVLGLKMKKASFLRSSEGCKQQHSHYDYNQTHLQEHLDQGGMMPKTLLLSFENGGVLPIQDIDGQWYFIHLSAGDAVLFNGNLLHCGGAYAFLHHRLHIYFDAIDIKCALSKFIAEDDSDSHSDSDNYETLLSMNDDGDITLEVSVSHAEADHRLAPSTIHVNKCKP